MYPTVCTMQSWFTIDLENHIGPTYARFTGCPDLNRQQKISSKYCIFEMGSRWPLITARVAIDELKVVAYKIISNYVRLSVSSDEHRWLIYLEVRSARIPSICMNFPKFILPLVSFMLWVAYDGQKLWQDYDSEYTFFVISSICASKFYEQS